MKKILGILVVMLVMITTTSCNSKHNWLNNTIAEPLTDAQLEQAIYDVNNYEYFQIFRDYGFNSFDFEEDYTELQNKIMLCPQTAMIKAKKITWKDIFEYQKFIYDSLQQVEYHKIINDQYINNFPDSIIKKALELSKACDPEYTIFCFPNIVASAYIEFGDSWEVANIKAFIDIDEEYIINALKEINPKFAIIYQFELETDDIL